MKFKHIIVTISVALICTAAFAKWPFGFIGLNVDQPLTQFDVGGDSLFRGYVFSCDSDWDGQISGYEMPEASGNHGIFICNNPNGAWEGFGIHDDELTSFGLTKMKIWNRIRFENDDNSFEINIDDKEFIVSDNQQISFNPGSILFTDTSSVDVTNTINSSDIVNSQMYVYLAKTDDRCSCTINLKVNIDYNFHLKIFSDNHGDGGLIKVQVYGHDWFSLTGIDEDQCIELEYLAGFPNKKRWQFMNAFNCYSIENIATDINWLSTDNGRISYDGSSL